MYYYSNYYSYSNSCIFYRTTMKDRGLEMISLLRNVQVGQHPITWVGHSKGGLFIKQILVHGTY